MTDDERNTVKVLLKTEIDCAGMPIVACVEAEVPDGDDHLDLALYDAMASACRLLAKAARDDQRRHTIEVASL